MDLKPLREQIIRISTRAQEGHIPSALSILDILYVLYNQILKIDPSHPNDPQRDRFVLSKGHAAIGLYVILAQRGFFPPSELEIFGAHASILGGHPDKNKIPGVEASTGSLGHGFPMSVGMALGLAIKKSPARVYTIIGDGEANEGSSWEAALLAAHHKLDNLRCIIDYNHSTDRALSVGDIQDKFRAFNWETISVDGHNHEAIRTALQHQPTAKPLAIIANTIKGFGCPIMENNPEWHHKFPKDEELQALVESLR